MTQLKSANAYDSLKDNMEELTMFMKHRSGQQTLSYKDMLRVHEEGGVSEITVDDGNYLDTCLGNLREGKSKLVLRFYDDEGVCSDYTDGVLDIVREIPSRVVYARDVYEMVTQNYRSLLAYEVENDIVVFGDMEMNLSTIESEFPGFTLAEVTDDAEIYELNC